MHATTNIPTPVIKQTRTVRAARLAAQQDCNSIGPRVVCVARLLLLFQDTEKCAPNEWGTNCMYRYNYMGADKSYPDQEGNKLMFLSEWREISFGALPCRGGGGKEKKNFMTARDSMLLKSRASLTCFRACFLPGRAKDLSACR